MSEFLLDYGDEKLAVDLPATTWTVRPGQTFPEPPPIDPALAGRTALLHPLGMPPLRELAKCGSKVVIAFPDQVKGGTHPNSHRRTMIPLLLDQLGQAGVRPQDIKLLCAIGLHRKNKREEFRKYLGDELVDQFWPDRLVCHDAEDPEGILALGRNEWGDIVEFNREAAEADLLVLLGHVAGNPYGGFSGGYKMPSTGLTTWRSIRCHHTPASLHRADFVPASPHSHFRQQLRLIGQSVEMRTGKRFFEVDAVIDSKSQVLGVYAGAVDLVERESWRLAKLRTDVYLPGRVDVLILGIPRSFHYGPGMGTNPILMLQAIGATLVRCRDVLNTGGVIIATSVCDGWFNDEWFPACREVFKLLTNATSLTELTQFEEEISTRPTYVWKYRSDFAYHPFHAFSMVYMGSMARRYASAVIIVGAKKPELAEAMGCISVPTFPEALREAERRVGKRPRPLVLEDFLTSVPLHVHSAG